MMADVLRSRIPETLDQMWDRWLTLVCKLDYGWYDAVEKTCGQYMWRG